MLDKSPHFTLLPDWVYFFCVFYMESNEQWRSTDLQESNIDYTSQELSALNLIIFAQENQCEVDILVCSGDCLAGGVDSSFSIFDIQKCQRHSDIQQAACLCTVYKTCHVIFQFLTYFCLLLRILHISFISVKIVTCYHGEVVFLNIAGLCKTFLQNDPIFNGLGSLLSVVCILLKVCTCDNYCVDPECTLSLGILFQT